MCIFTGLIIDVVLAFLKHKNLCMDTFNLKLLEETLTDVQGMDDLHTQLLGDAIYK